MESININLNINYNNPFIYFDQGHILGIDIKQDMYPIMKGLCIINDNSLYSEIAQGMYRLRKLNMGHSIIFLYKNNTKTITARKHKDTKEGRKDRVPNFGRCDERGLAERIVPHCVRKQDVNKVRDFDPNFER